MDKVAILTAITLYTQPKQLSFNILHNEQTDEYGLLVTHRPERNYRPVLSATPFTESRAAVLKELRHVLNTVYFNINKLDEERMETLFDVLKPNSQDQELITVLTPKVINDIIERLQDSDIVNMYETG